MAIIHNLSDPADNLTGFDPVAGESDGTSIGKSWVLWKIFEGLMDFDSTIKKITNAAPTPTFLQSEVGSNLQTEPAKNRATIGDSIRWYKTDDPGLSQTPAKAIIYEWRITNVVTANYGYTIRTRHKIDGETTYAPGSDNDFCRGDSSTIGISFYHPLINPTTITMANIPKIIFWKSAHAVCMVAINKVDGSHRGGLYIFNPQWSGYKVTIGSITDGIDNRCVVQATILGTHSIIEAFSQTYNATTSTIVSGLISELDIINSGGSMPNGLMSFSSENNLISGKLRLGVQFSASLKIISEEIEGALLTNPSNISLPAMGGIQVFNSKYYLGMGTISDGRQLQRVLLELEAV